MGTKWRETKNSPDWIDVFATQRALEALHSVIVYITMTAAVFDGPGGCITIAAIRSSRHGDASVLGEPVICISGDWPCKEHADVQSCVYSGLLSMDSALSRNLWGQMDLPFTAP